MIALYSEDNYEICLLYSSISLANSKNFPLYPKANGKSLYETGFRINTCLSLNWRFQVIGLETHQSQVPRNIHNEILYLFVAESYNANTEKDDSKPEQDACFRQHIHQAPAAQTEIQHALHRPGSGQDPYSILYRRRE